MPVTTAGTAYTTRSQALTGYGTTYITMRDSIIATTDIPTIVYAHGAGGQPDQFVSLPAWQQMLFWCMDNGWAVVEGPGGPGSTSSPTGGQNWANTTARAAYTAYATYWSGVFSLKLRCLFGRSMGGLVTGWLLLNEPLFAECGWLNNSGVSTMLVESGGVPSTGEYFRSGAWPAWGVSNLSDFATAVTAAGAALENYPASAWAGKKILNLYGDADTTVPFGVRGAGPLRNIWHGLPAIDDIYVRPGGTHSAPNASYADVSPMAAFLTTLNGGTPVPPPAPTDKAYKVGEEYLLGNDTLLRRITYLN